MLRKKLGSIIHRNVEEEMTESPSINRDIIGACNSKIHDIDVKIELYKDRIKALKENRKYWIGLAKQIEKLKKHG